MNDLLAFANLFAETQAGQLLYFLVVISLSLASLLIAIEQRTRGPYEAIAQRYVLACAGVMAAWGLLTLGNLLGLLIPALDPEWLLPPLERAVQTGVFFLLMWAFLTAEGPRPDGLAQGLAALGLALLAAAFMLSFALWSGLGEEAEFNQHLLGLLWTVLPMLLALGSLFILLEVYGRAADVPLKLLFLLLVFLGQAAALYLMGQGDLRGDSPAMARLTMLLALPILPIILYRMVIDRFRSAVGEASGWVATVAPPPPVQAPSLPPSPVQIANREALNLIKILGMMLEQTQPKNMPLQIARAIAETFQADVVALLALNQPNWADPIVAYHYVREQTLAPMAINLDYQPTLKNALDLNLQALLQATRQIEELKDLFHRLDIQDAHLLGPAYLQPLARDRQVIAALVLAYPFTARILREDELQQLRALAPIAARLLAISRQAMEAQVPAYLPEEAGLHDTAPIRAEMQAEIEHLQGQIADLIGQNDQLNVVLRQEREKIAQVARGEGEMSITQKIQVAAQEKDQLNAARDHLLKTLQQVQALWAGATADSDAAVYQQMVESLGQEKQHLLAERARLERELASFRGASPQDYERMADIINDLMIQNERLAQESQGLQAQISQAQGHLESLGLESNLLGFTQLVGHLTEERNRFQQMSKRAMAERDLLHKELQNLKAARETEQERTQQIINLQAELARLAADREALIHQREELLKEGQDLDAQRQDWLAARAKLVKEYEALQQQVAPEPRLTDTLARLGGDLKAPVTNIRDYAHLLLNQSAGLLSQTQQQFLGRILSNAERLQHLGDDFNRGLALEYGQVSLAPRQVDLADVADDAITASSPHYRQKGLSLNLDLPADLPPLHTDPDALRQILTELLINACGASPTGGQVQLAAQPKPEGGVEIWVRDSGPGLAPADLARVFEPPTGAPLAGLGGTGSGLYLAKLLSQAMGAELSVQSQPGGAGFCLVVSSQ